MKRWATRLVSGLLLLSVVAGCSSNANGDTKQASEPKQEKKVTLRFSFWGDDARKLRMEKMIAQFNEKYPNVQVETIMIPNAEYHQKIGIMAASKTEPDVAWLRQDVLLEYVAGNQLLDLSELKTDKEFNYGDIFPTSSGALSKNDKIYGIPFSSAPRMIFFNKTLFKEKGIKNPLEQAKAGEWTYENYLKTATAMNDSSKGIYGTSLVMIVGWKSWLQNYLDTIWAFGGQILSDDGTKFLLNSPEGEKALQFISDLIFKYQVHPKPGDQIAYSFETGKLAMSRQDFSYINNARKIKDFEWDIAPMPTNIASALNSVGNPGYAIFKETKHPKEAMAFLKFMSGAEGTLQLADLFVAPRKSLLESDAFQKGGTAPSSEGIKYALTEVFTKGVRTEYAHKNWTQIDLKMQRALDRLYTKEDVKTVLKIMEEEITPLLK